MKLLFISKSGSSLGLAERVRREGHTSYFYVLSDQFRRSGNGIVDKVVPQSIVHASGHVIAKNVDSLLSDLKPDLIVFDDIGTGRVADYIRGKGVGVLGGCFWADHAEHDILYACKLMKTVDIRVYETGVDGIEMSCGMWWNGLSSNIHYLVFADGLGSVVKMVSPKTKLVRGGVGRMERLLKKTSYRGPIELNMIVTSDSIYGLDLTVHLNHNTYALFELYKGSLTQLLWSVASGTNEYEKFSNDYAIAIRLLSPSEKVPLMGVSEKSERHIWWHNMCRKGENWLGVGSELLSASARGRDMLECRKRVYRTIMNLVVDGDIGERVNKDMRQIKAWGYL